MKNVFLPVALIAGVLAVLVWLGFECFSTRTFIGTVVSKNTSIQMYHDEERLTVDSEGHISTTGTDETVAYKTYKVVFYCEGEMRTITCGTNRGYAPYARADAMALADLARNDVEPAHYTYSNMNVEYLVKVSGWLFDGSIREITPMNAIKAE